MGFDESETLTGADTGPSAEIDVSDLAELVEPLSEDALELSNNPDVAPNGVSADPTSVGTQVSMEELLSEVETGSNADSAAIDAVDIFNTGDLTDASAQFGSMTGGLLMIAVFPAPISTGWTVTQLMRRPLRTPI